MTIDGVSLGRSTRRLTTDFVHPAFRSSLISVAKLGRASSLALANWFSHRAQRCIVPNSNLVYVVDDDQAILAALQRLLRQHGYDSRLFESAEAIENHSDFEGVICIIIDINLNNRSGIDVRYRLKAAGISVPVIYVTGKDSPAVREEALKSGCIAFLKKPFSAISLIEPLKALSQELGAHGGSAA
jgi:CheY-like chemotaxis protein